MKHMENPMKKTTSQSDEFWYIDFGASNHMTSYEEWFSYLEKPEKLGVVEQETTLRIRSNISVKFRSATSDRKGTS